MNSGMIDCSSFLYILRLFSVWLSIRIILEVKLPIKCCRIDSRSLSSVGMLISSSKHSLNSKIKFSRLFLWPEISSFTICRAVRCLTNSSTAFGRPAIDRLAYITQSFSF